jgi:hypothetical protein
LYEGLAPLGKFLDLCAFPSIEEIEGTLDLKEQAVFFRAVEIFINKFHQCSVGIASLAQTIEERSPGTFSWWCPAEDETRYDTLALTELLSLLDHLCTANRLVNTPLVAQVSNNKPSRHIRIVPQEAC